MHNRLKNRFYPLTSIMPLPFFSPAAIDDIEQRRCPLCHRSLENRKTEYCLIGRHSLSHRSKLPPWANATIDQATGKAYQAAYVAICHQCNKKRNNRESLKTTYFAVLSIVFVLLILSGVAHWTHFYKAVNMPRFVELYAWQYLVQAFVFLAGMGLIAWRLFDFRPFSERIIQKNHYFPALGLPKSKSFHYVRLVDLNQLRSILSSGHDPWHMPEIG